MDKTKSTFVKVPLNTDIRPYTCVDCGASIADVSMAFDKHIEWHEKMDELIEWAQAVSAVIKGTPQEEPEWVGEGHGGPGKKLGPNSGLLK